MPSARLGSNKCTFLSHWFNLTRVRILRSTNEGGKMDAGNDEDGDGAAILYTRCKAGRIQNRPCQISSRPLVAVDVTTEIGIVA